MCVRVCVCVRNATAEFPMTALLTRSSLHELPESRPSALSHPLITYSWSWAGLQMSVLLTVATFGNVVWQSLGLMNRLWANQVSLRLIAGR